MHNPDYTREDLSQSDKSSIYRMKLASDMVHAYYQQMNENYRSLEQEDHTKRIEALVESVRLTLEYNEDQINRVNFFIANVFEAIYQLLKLENIDHLSFLKPEMIASLYSKSDLVMDFMEETAVEIGYACGNFVAESNPSVLALAALEQARAGDVVGVDYEYFNMLEPEEMFEVMATELMVEGFFGLPEADSETRANAFLKGLQLFDKEFNLGSIVDMEI